MESDYPSGRRIYFGFEGFLLEPAKRILTKDGEVIELQAQVFDLLHYLVQHSGEVISKDQLLADVWKNRYLGDAVIAQAVKKARLALGDDGRKQTFIRTVHGRGISFLPEVVEHSLDRIDDTRSAPSETPAPDRSALRWLMPFTALVLIGTLLWNGASAPEPTPELDPSLSLARQTLVVFPFDSDSNRDGNGDADNSESGLDWLQIGLAQTTALLLDRSGGLQVLTPQDVLALPEGSAAEQMALLGSRTRLEARVQTSDGVFNLEWQLTHGDRPESVETGEISSSDSSQLARRLADTVLNVLAGQPDAPLPSQPVLQDPLASELYARAIQAIYSDRRAQARALLQAALTREPNSVPLRVAYAQASFDPSNVRQSIDAATAVLDELIEADPVAAASLIKTIGIELWNSGEIDASAALLQRGLDLLDGRDAEGLRAALLNALAMSLNSQSRFDEAWDMASRAELIFRELNDPYHLGLVLTNMAYFAEDRGRILQAGDLHRQALDIRQRYQFPQLIAASQYGLARIERRSGQFDQAQALLDQSLATVTELGLAFDRFDNLEELAEVNMRQGQFVRARSRIDQAAKIAEDNDDALGQAWAKQVSGRIALRERRIDSASLETIASARDALESMGEDQDVLTASLELVEAHLQLSNSEDPSLDPSADIEAILDRLTSSEMVANPVLKLQYDAMRAQLMTHAGQISQAMSAYSDLVRQARQIGVVDLEAEYAIRLGQLALLEPDFELARSMLAIASRWSSDYYRTRALAESIAADQSQLEPR